jgi:hypothetical protein
MKPDKSRATNPDILFALYNRLTKQCNIWYD